MSDFSRAHLDAWADRLLNAGAAILVGGGADDLESGIERARESLDSDAARDVLARLVEASGRLAGTFATGARLQPRGSTSSMARIGVLMALEYRQPTRVSRRRSRCR